MGEKLYDLDFLNRISNNDSAFIHEMVTSLIESADEYMEKADKFLSEKNYESFGRATHKFIPGVGFLGIKSIEQELMLLEENCKKNIDLDKIEEKYKEVKSTILKLEEVFKQDFNL